MSGWANFWRTIRAISNHYSNWDNVVSSSSRAVRRHHLFCGLSDRRSAEKQAMSAPQRLSIAAVRGYSRRSFLAMEAGRWHRAKRSFQTDVPAVQSEWGAFIVPWDISARRARTSMHCRYFRLTIEQILRGCFP